MPWDRKRRTEADRQRARDYGKAEHRKRRAEGQRLVDTGRATCWRCSTRIAAGSHRWHLGHDDHDRTRYRGVECVRCNLSAAARKGALVANARRRGRPDPVEPSRPRTSRAW